MQTVESIKTELKKVFNVKQATVLSKIIVNAYDELVKADDFNELKGIVKELAEAQKELAEAQKRTEERVEELAGAQKRTEESLNRLIGRVDIIQDRLEGVSNSVGYSLEDKAYESLPGILKQEGIEVAGRLIRRYYETKKGKQNQINIYGKGKRGDEEILILGEVKVRPSKKEIEDFLKIVEVVKEAEGNPSVYLIFLAHDYHPNTERYLKEKGIRYFWSYELKT